MATYLPEGYRTQCASAANFHTIASVRDAMLSRQILESRALVCDAGHNLIVDLGCMKGMIPREECAIGIREGTTRDIAILSKVNKPVCFRITDVRSDEKFRPYALLSRREVQEECRSHYLFRGRLLQPQQNLLPDALGLVIGFIKLRFSLGQLLAVVIVLPGAGEHQQ